MRGLGGTKMRTWFGKKRDEAPPRDVGALAAPLAAPAVRVTGLDEPSLSHFGGSPRLLPRIAWPERNGVRLGFLARICLAEVHRAHVVPWLPKEGSLLFFYDMEEQTWGFDPNDRGSAAVLLVPDLPGPTGRPDGEPDEDVSPFPYRNLGFRRIDVLPSLARDSVRALKLTDQETEEYLKIADARFDGMPKHQISGLPAVVQSDTMELECQLVSNGLYCGEPQDYEDPRVAALQPGAANWRLLFQIDTDDDLGVMWGDCGTIYYWVEEEEARSGNFSNAWLILQCG
jgi:uncharacterized protein YwqG